MVNTQGRALALLAGAIASSGCLVRVAWPAGLEVSRLPATLASDPPQQSLPLLLAVAMLAVCSWLALLLLVGLAARVPGATGRLATRALCRLAPAAVRRTIEVLLGASTVLAASTGAAQAVSAAPVQAHVVIQAPQRPAVLERAAVLPVVSGLDRPASPALPQPAPAFSLDRPATDPGRGLGLVSALPTRSVASQAKSTTVTVRPGDSLWRIAARSLPSDTSQRAIERAWHRWYAANRGVIGADPSLLQPGQQLTPPQP